MNGENDLTPPTAQMSIVHYQRGAPGKRDAVRTLIDERLLTLEVSGGGSYSLMRTPGRDRELAVGFLFTEGIIDTLDDILTLEECLDNHDLIRVRVRQAKELPGRSLRLMSSCGLCGHPQIDELVAGLGTVAEGGMLHAEHLYALPAAVLERQGLFRQTGGAHAAALFDMEGRVMVVREDIGRHNALDKALGHALFERFSCDSLGIYLSGRASLEMIVKAAQARAVVVASAKAPSALAAEVAERTGMTLCGFVRGREFAVYCHERRICRMQ